MATIKDLQKLHGVQADIAQEHEHLTVYTVNGPGYTTMIRVDDDGRGYDSADQDALDARANKKQHLARVDAIVNPPTAPEPPPTVEQRLEAALGKLNPSKATVADVIAAVKAAVQPPK
jgi:hypothetical protein